MYSWNHFFYKIHNKFSSTIFLAHSFTVLILQLCSFTWQSETRLSYYNVKTKLVDLVGLFLSNMLVQVDSFSFLFKGLPFL